MLMFLLLITLSTHVSEGDPSGFRSPDFPLVPLAVICEGFVHNDTYGQQFYAHYLGTHTQWHFQCSGEIFCSLYIYVSCPLERLHGYFL